MQEIVAFNILCAIIAAKWALELGLTQVRQALFGAAALVVGLTGWTAADPLVSLGIAVLIVVGAVRILRESVNVLLEAAPAHIPVPELERRMRAVPGVAAVHDLHLWTVTSGVVAMSGHAVVPDLADHPGALERLRVAAAGMGVQHVTIQLETEAGCEGEGCGGGQGERGAGGGERA